MAAVLPVLKARRFDLCVLSPNHACVNSVFLYLFGVPVIVGAYIPSVWQWHVGVENQFLTRSVTQAQMHGKKGVLLQFAQAYARTLTGREDLELAALVPYLRFKDEALPAALADKTIVTIHPGGAPYKRWPPERFAEIARLVVQHHDGAICILGGPPEAEYAEQIVKAIVAASPNSAVFNACGASINQTLTYLAHSTMFVGHGAAPMHLAVALGVPVVALLLGGHEYRLLGAAQRRRSALRAVQGPSRRSLRERSVGGDSATRCAGAAANPVECSLT